MTRTCVLLALIVLPWPGASARAQIDRAYDGVALEHGWLLDYDRALRRARETGRPLMAVIRCLP